MSEIHAAAVICFLLVVVQFNSFPSLIILEKIVNIRPTGLPSARLAIMTVLRVARKSTKRTHRTREEWGIIDAALKKRRKEGKNSEVFEWGHRMNEEKLHKGRNRPGLPYVQQRALEEGMSLNCGGQSVLLNHESAKTYRLPLGMAILSPISKEASHELQICLPSRQFDQEMSEELRAYQQSREPYPGQEIMTIENAALHTKPVTPERNSQLQEDSSSFHAFDVCASESLELESRMLMEDNDRRLPTDSSSFDGSLYHYVSPLYRRILFSVSNNFAGLEAHSEEVITYLRKNTKSDLYDIISSSSCYAAKAVLRNLFKGAIEAGDDKVVRGLLQNPSVDIDPNLQICHIAGAQWTPIERAAARRDHGIVAALLDSRYKIDVNKSFSRIGPRGALDNAVIRTSRPSNTSIKYLKYERVDLRIFERLLEAGGNMTHDSLKKVIEARDGEIFLKIMETLGRSHHNTWNIWGIFRLAFGKLDAEACEKLVELLVDVGTDLNYQVQGNVRGTWPRTIIDMIAKRGFFGVALTLIDQGAKPTGNTLGCAVSSGSLRMVNLFLEKGCHINDIGTLWITPLAAAIRLQDPEMKQFLERKGAWAYLGKKRQFSSALNAACEVGDVECLLRLVELGGDVTPEDLGLALVVLVMGGHDEKAHSLIEAGADLDYVSPGHKRNGPALLETLKRRDQELVTLLLDVGANPNYGTFHDGLNGTDPAIQLAVEWGDHGVVKRLITEGVNVNDCGKGARCRPALTIAVDIQDEALIDILLEAGADPNHPNIQLKGDSPLAAATRKGHSILVQRLLDHGADPDDPAALVAAYTLNSCDIKDQLIKRHRQIYPQPRKGFGSAILKDAVLRGDPNHIKKLLKDRMDPWELAPDRTRRSSAFGTAIVTNQPRRNDIVALFLEKDPRRSNDIVVASYSSRLKRRTSLGLTALTAAAETRDKDLVKMLVAKGADLNPSPVGRIKRTPIQRAAELGFDEMVIFVIRLGADVNAASASRGGGTALQLAAARGSLRTVKTLLDYEADINAPPAAVDGWTVIEGAAKFGRLDTIKMLLNAHRMQSGGNEELQFVRAKQYARSNGHFEIADLLDDDGGYLERSEITEIMDA